VLAGAPRRQVEVPPAVEAVASGRTVSVVWENELGGLTFELTGDGGHQFVKWSPAGCGIDMRLEEARMIWAAPYTPVPKVMGSGGEETGAWLITDAAPGKNAVSDRWKRDPATAVAAIGEGLRALHEALPVDGCPFSWAAEHRVADAQHAARLGHVDPSRWHPEHRHLRVGEAARLVEAIPAIDVFVVCHGDACAPNTLLTDDGRWSAHVDLGALGVADRWADIAVATWSTEWNYGPGWDNALLEAYGVAPDPVRTSYYRLLWDLT
jgi:kanamycin kinase